MLGKQIAVERIVRIFEEGLRAVLAALRDVVEVSRKYRPCQPSYRVSLPKVKP